MDRRTEREAEANRRRLLEATAATLLLLKRRRRSIVSVGIRYGLPPTRIAASLKDSLRTGLIEARQVARAHGLGSLERELVTVGRELGVARAEARHIVRDVYRAVSQSTSYAQQWLKAAKETSVAEANATTNHALKRTATTEAVDAFNEARLAALEEIAAPELGRRWDAKADACEFCDGLDGTIVPAGEAFPDGEAPIHPHCQCTWSLVEMNSGVAIWRLPRGSRPDEGIPLQ